MNDLKEFEKFLKICRKQGVTDVTYMGTTVKFGDLPQKANSEESEDILTDGISPEELAFYAVGQVPGN